MAGCVAQRQTSNLHPALLHPRRRRGVRSQLHELARMRLQILGTASNLLGQQGTTTASRTRPWGVLSMPTNSQSTETSLAVVLVDMGVQERTNPA
eukprot:6416210-Pyramimonas_sp.AAC.1